ncbi:hypothetical protein [Enterovibrio norvegicus]|uniref:hypothetical protein n=1 Tax=Enterovibrio norvegicus TaxID=188144 RepID=UPI000C81B9BA|nr:hypothetical protein [Enterovibrio norvegicus]PMN73134.1 hypothetical protein BCT27_12375 [Enterovibrio norvegicus]
MAKLTAKEKNWIKDMQKLLDACPSQRLGFYANGDRDVGVFDVTMVDEVHDRLHEGSGEFCTACDELGAAFGVFLEFPNQVHSTAG